MCFCHERAEQRYTCLIPDRRYRCEGLFLSFIAELEYRNSRGRGHVLSVVTQGGRG